MLTDVTIPGDRIVIKKEVKKILKYTDLTTERERAHARMCVCGWNVKTKVIPVIMWTNGTITKSFRNHKLQKTAILGNAHILWKWLI